MIYITAWHGLDRPQRQGGESPNAVTRRRPGPSQHPTVESVQSLIMSSSFKARYVWVASRRQTYPFQSSVVPGSGWLVRGWKPASLATSMTNVRA